MLGSLQVRSHPLTLCTLSLQLGLLTSTRLSLPLRHSSPTTPPQTQFWAVRDYLAPVLRDSKFKESGRITPEEFVAAGDYLCYKFPTWQWEAGEPSKRRDFLPADKQYLVSRNGQFGSFRVPLASRVLWRGQIEETRVNKRVGPESEQCLNSLFTPLTLRCPHSAVSEKGLATRLRWRRSRGRRRDAHVVCSRRRKGWRRRRGVGGDAHWQR